MNIWQGTWQSIRRWLSHRLASWQKPDKVTPEPTAPTPAPLRLESPLQPCVSVIIPALNEQKRIADVVRYALSDSATAEVLVVDDSSVDRPARPARA